ncbi:uncharacterized protein LOC136096813 [Hydra vulgaris]|uniref:uncharacterized protein LOC136096813 n=1 Tax=Hydra vulgaris TaxID=6087 RepID=UPI0032EA18B0
MLNTLKDTCLLYKDLPNQTINVVRKGIKTLIHYSQVRNDKDLEKELKERNTVVVHVACRRDFTNPNRKVLKCQMESPKIKKLRSTDIFNWKRCCFICGNLALPDSKHRDRKVVIQVHTIKFKQSLLKVCEDRIDIWAVEVKSRLNCSCDLVASDAMLPL